jgi:hypothetical protein
VPEKPPQPDELTLKRKLAFYSGKVKELREQLAKARKRGKRA